KEDIAFLKEYFHAAKFGNSGVSIPLIQSDNLVGVLVVVKTELVEREIDTLELLADHVSVALLSMKEVEERRAMYNAMLLSLTRSVDTKSRWTAGHSERVTTHAVALAVKLGFDKETREKIRIAALLHDIGKLGVSETILDKPDKLTDEEFGIIRNHPVMGEEIIKDIPHFSMVKSVVRHHHEKWDGTGYPDGLSKDAIPFAARIVAIADVWDALTADRPYRKGFSHVKALDIMKSEKGKLFDPALLDIFIQDQ
ncbi:MAG: HD domain-containing protein, partial [Clostridiales bacterium]|nr:HD domain-containing protein [Clostridiales bacterium]